VHKYAFIKIMSIERHKVIIDRQVDLATGIVDRAIDRSIGRSGRSSDLKCGLISMSLKFYLRRYILKSRALHIA
jgi:hypothetical protein